MSVNDPNLVNAECLVGDLAKSSANEQARRIYYQNIVYNVCNLLDQLDNARPGKGIVCGTVDAPSTKVQVRVAELVREVVDLRRRKG